MTAAVAPSAARPAIDGPPAAPPHAALDDGLDGPRQQRGELPLGEDRVVVAVDAERLAVLDRLEQPDLAAHRHDVVAHRHDRAGRHVDLGEPRAGVVRADRLAGLEHHPPVVLGDLLQRPRLPGGRLALQVELVQRPRAGLRRCQPGDAGQAAEADEAELLLPRRAEVGRRRAEHQARTSCGWRRHISWAIVPPIE